MTDVTTERGSKLLVVLRHAKAESSATRDHARRLTSRGRRDAVAAGRWLLARGLVPERALLSSATRAQESFEGVCEGLGRPVRAQVLDSLYLASVEEAMTAFAVLPASVRSVLVVGHNPTMSGLAQALRRPDPPDTSGPTDPLAPADSSEPVGARTDLPTAGLVVLDYAGDWDVLVPGTALLRDSFRPPG